MLWSPGVKDKWHRVPLSKPQDLRRTPQNLVSESPRTRLHTSCTHLDTMQGSCISMLCPWHDGMLNLPSFITDLLW